MGGLPRTAVGVVCASFPSAVGVPPPNEYYPVSGHPLRCATFEDDDCVIRDLFNPEGAIHDGCQLMVRSVVLAGEV